MSDGRNRLADETSPYLLQHAGNPVHWWACGPSISSGMTARHLPGARRS